MRRETGLVAIGVALALLVGCQSTVTGNEGNFQFSYDADDRITDFNKPIAVGAFLDLEVRDVGAQQPVDLSAAQFDDTSVLEVTEFAGHEITIQGMGDGSALLEVEGENANGEVLTDSVNMLSRVPEVLLLWHTCSTEDPAGYLTNQRVWVPFEMEMTNSQPVIGYGYYPLTLDANTSGDINVVDSGQQYMAFDTSATAGDIVLSSDIDDATLTMSVFEESSIDGVVEPIAFVAEDIDVGDVNAFYVLPSVGGVPVCQADATKTVATDTPEICDVRDRQAEQGAGDLEHEYGWFEIEGVAQGTCLYTVTYPSGNAGEGASAQFSYEIQP